MKISALLVFAVTVAACGGSVDPATPSGPGPDPSPTPDHPTPPASGDAGSPVATDAAPSVAPPSVPNPGSTIAFTPTAVDAGRFPVTCGVMNPPFKAGDLFSLDVIGSMTAAPYDALSITFTSPAVVGQPIPLAVQPFLAMGSGIGQPNGSTTWYPAQRAQGGGVTFSYTQGSDPSEIDTGAFDSATVTIVAMPTQDGAPLGARLQLHFVDGRTLDERFSGSLFTEWGGCGAP